MRTIRQIARNTLSLALVLAISLTTLCYTQQVAANSESNPSFAKSEEAPKLSPRLRPGKRAQVERVSVILELNGAPSKDLRAFLRQDRVHLRRELKKSYVFSIDLPFNKVAELSSFPEVFHISTNDPVSPVGHVTATTGTDAGRAAASGSGTVDGGGIGIAILDSGIDTNHVQFSSVGSPSRVAASVDFTGENRTDDPYGHGTFVAAAAAGNDRAGSSYLGIAPGAKLCPPAANDSSAVDASSFVSCFSAAAALTRVAACASNMPKKSPLRGSRF